MLEIMWPAKSRNNPFNFSATLKREVKIHICLHLNWPSSEYCRFKAACSDIIQVGIQ